MAVGEICGNGGERGEAKSKKVMEGAVGEGAIREKAVRGKKEGARECEKRLYTTTNSEKQEKRLKFLLDTN